ncbi:MAG: hypothetical protein JWN51_2766 [Phycisphaerales bacterium]|nr:hypothetical protein [Phycisphaerales bacterium]
MKMREIRFMQVVQGAACLLLLFDFLLFTSQPSGGRSRPPDGWATGGRWPRQAIMDVLYLSAIHLNR